MDSNAQLIFENVCTQFLNDQLQYATPPILNVECGLVGQLLVESRRSRFRNRSLRGFDIHIDDSSRALASSSSSMLKADVQVTGEVEKTPSVQETADVQFQKLLVGTFNVQGYLFAGSLKEEEEDDNETTSTSSTYYQSVGAVRGIDADGANAQESSEGDGGDAVLFTKGVIAAIVVGGLIVLMLLLLIGMKARKRRQCSESSRNQQSKAVKTNTKSSSSATAKKTAASTKSPPSPTSLTITNTSSSTSSPRSSTTAASSKSSSHHRRLRREIMAPSGKLGIIVANTTKPSHGPAVHTIRPGSPMEGLVYVNDIIVGVNDVDTRKFTAEEITQVMKDTAGEGRKIVVLSAHR